MVSKKIAEQARVLSAISRAQMNNSLSGTDHSSFTRMLVAAMERTADRVDPVRTPVAIHQDFSALEKKGSDSLVNRAASAGASRDIIDIILTHEGSSYVRRDGGEESSKYGILQATANKHGYRGPVKNLSRSEAIAIYQKIWKESGAEKLPYPLSLVHFDTYVNSPAAATRLLKTTGGDVDTYLKERADRYTRLATLKPARFGKYLAGWMNRIKSLETMVKQHRYDRYFAAGPYGIPSKKS